MKKPEKKRKKLQTSGYTLGQLQGFFFLLSLLALLAIVFFIYKATTKELILGASTFMKNSVFTKQEKKETTAEPNFPLVNIYRK